MYLYHLVYMEGFVAKRHDLMGQMEKRKLFSFWKYFDHVDTCKGSQEPPKIDKC